MTRRVFEGDHTEGGGDLGIDGSSPDTTVAPPPVVALVGDLFAAALVALYSAVPMALTADAEKVSRCMLWEAEK